MDLTDKETPVIPNNTRAALTAALREEIANLWCDMGWAVRDAHDNCWSLRCEGLARRIVTLSRLVGPTRWDDVEIGLLVGGVYERVYRDAGIEVPPVRWDLVRESHERMKAVTGS